MNILFRIADILLFPVIRLIFRAKQKGKENIPKSGPVIIAANHLHAFDMFFISTFSRRSIRFLAKADFSEILSADLFSEVRELFR